MIRVAYEFDGAQTVDVDLNAAPIYGRAGMILGVFAYEGENFPDHDVPVDEEQYAYTHGGDEYRAAVRAIWEALGR